MVDSYLDTEDWRIARAGFVLRTRRRGRHDEITLKDTQAAQEGGLRQRLEVTEDLPAAGVAALGRDGPVGRRVYAVAGGGRCARSSRSGPGDAPSSCGWAASTLPSWPWTTP